MSDKEGVFEEVTSSRAVIVSDVEERLIYAYISGNQKDVTAAKENLFLVRGMSDGQPSPEVIERLIKNDPINAAKAGLLRSE